MRDTPVVSGVYFLFKKEELIYVGQSKDCYGRIEDHRSNGREFDMATVMPLQAQFLGSVEKALIKAYRPPCNMTHKPSAAKASVFRSPVVPEWTMPPAPRPEPPRPDGLGLITINKARELARFYGLVSSVIDRAAEDGTLCFVGSTSRRGRFNLRMARYDDVRAFLERAREEKLSELGFAPAADAQKASAA